MRHDLIRRLETLGNPRVVVVGDLILDRYIWGFADRISQEAPVPLLRAISESIAWGARRASQPCSAPWEPRSCSSAVSAVMPKRTSFAACFRCRESTTAWCSLSTTGRPRSRNATSAGHRIGTRSR